ncbi:replicative DNA helicase [Arsenicicoccus bolidensis]|uniref:replicative DNA helicase n=1 Tax=Arsenicicoccus bolidensis TaxID=229480 RepID=UPI00041548FE|nr:replicative DNA helicase [Arsenicicoccus bolidensis]
MSIAELDDRRDYGAERGGPGGGGSGGDDRVPPQDVHAEQSVLGSMMLSKDAIADCVETLRGLDFYRPAHETIYEAIIDLYGRGEPADAITVADELTKRGEIQRIGGQAYLHQLIDAVPTAANAGYYAEIVQERAVLRRLVDAGTRIVQMGYGQGGDVEDIVNAAQAEVYQVADKRGGEDYIAVGEVLEATIDEIEHASGKNGEMVGVPTGFTELDQLTNGLHPGQMIVIAARPAVGKALALDTPLVTPTGWTTMGEVQVGDEVIGADGRPTRVVAATEVMTDRPCYEVAFSDGSTIVADAQHQWVTSADGDEQVRTTEEIAGSYDAGGAQHLVRSRRDEAEWTIVRLSPASSVPVRCIQVDNDDHLYLAGRSMIPTHNSTLALDIARSAAIHNQQATVLFSLEMSKTEITMRLLSAEASIQLQKLRKGELADDDWTKIARTTGRLSEAPFFIDDSPNMSLMEIRAKCRRLKQRNNLKLVVIDYLQLMSSGKRVESRQQEVSEFSRALKLLAKEIEVPVIALSQLNRGPEQRTDKKPMVSDLRESGSIEQDADMVVLLHRESMYEKESPREGEADVIVAKHRNGPTGTIVVAFQGHYSRFTNMATNF